MGFCYLAESDVIWGSWGQLNDFAPDLSLQFCPDGRSRSFDVQPDRGQLTPHSDHYIAINGSLLGRRERALNGLLRVWRDDAAAGADIERRFCA